MSLERLSIEFASVDLIGLHWDSWFDEETGRRVVMHKGKVVPIFPGYDPHLGDPGVDFRNLISSKYDPQTSKRSHWLYQE